MNNKNEILEAMIIYKFNGKNQFILLKNLNLSNGLNLLDSSYKIKTGLVKINESTHKYNFVEDIAQYYIGEEISENEAKKHAIIQKTISKPWDVQFKYIMANNGAVFEIEDWEEVLNKKRLSNLKLYQLFDQKFYLGLSD